MELELRLDPDDASRLPRLKFLAPAARGRPQQQRIVWHDTPDAALTAQGLALARERGLWRLEKLVPEAGDTWPPGAPPPVLAQAADPAELGAELPEPLAPAVAFAGRHQTYTLETPHGAVTLGVTRGMLRTITTEHAACRVHLSGDAQAVLPVALALAAEVAGGGAVRDARRGGAGHRPRQRAGPPPAGRDDHAGGPGRRRGLRLRAGTPDRRRAAFRARRRGRTSAARSRCTRCASRCAGCAPPSRCSAAARLRRIAGGQCGAEGAEHAVGSDAGLGRVPGRDRTGRAGGVPYRARSSRG